MRKYPTLFYSIGAFLNLIFEFETWSQLEAIK